MVLSDAYRDEEVTSGDKTETRTVLKFHPALAPFTAAVFPLVKKDGMPEAAHKIEADLRRQFNVTYDEKGAVGRRYRRQDEIGTPFCLTIDGDTISNGTVTVRDRDTMAQETIPAENARRYLEDKVDAWTPDA